MNEIREQLKAWQRMRRLFLYRYPESTYIVQFLGVGFLGFCLNMLVLTLSLWAGIFVKISLILGIAASTTFNFSFDRHFVFAYAKKRDLAPQFTGFVLVCLLGAMLNYTCATELLLHFPHLMPHLAELVGILVGTTFNYILLRFLIFRKA